ncbi:MAG: proline--tRNA ligase [Syntrophomonadaceae bacterium]|nr:proline--tRNA ligase [Syntrophomonadaceae bacterium]
MKITQLLFPTLREEPSDAEVISHKLLMRAGMIRRTAGGIYTYLPLGLRVLKKISQIVREEMDRAGGQEVGLPTVQPRELWDMSGRWQLYGDEMFRLKDRHQRDFCLGPTHEEVITTLIDGDVHSYRDLPLLIYQIKDKFRDEIRPRYGLLRGREFIMKDLYSFDVDSDGLEISYRKMYEAYSKIFERMGLTFRVVEADTGAIGGNESHEFMVLAGSGESKIVFCDTCHYSANVEKAESLPQEKPSVLDFPSIEMISTPDVRTVEDVVKSLGVSPSQVIKTLIYVTDDQGYAVLIRGDRELNELKLSNYLQGAELALAPENVVKELVGASIGSVGPVGLNLKILADFEIQNMTEAVCGANQESQHLIHVLPGRDFVPHAYIDLRNVQGGDPCPHCKGLLNEIRGIEVGHIFKLGTKYSQAMDAWFLDEKGNKSHFVMGCYGIGVSRIMAAAIEQKHDQNGIVWPMAIAPFQVLIVPVNIKDEEQARHAFAIYESLIQNGVEVLLDDREERAGVKFKDADLIGIPLRLTIGSRALKEGKVELKKRWEAESELVSLEEIAGQISSLISQYN